MIIFLDNAKPASPSLRAVVHFLIIVFWLINEDELFFNCFTLKLLPPLQLPFPLKKVTFVKMLKYLCLLFIMILVIIYLHVYTCMCVCVFGSVWVHMDMGIHVCVRAEVDVE